MNNLSIINDVDFDYEYIDNIIFSKSNKCIFKNEVLDKINKKPYKSIIDSYGIKTIVSEFMPENMMVISYGNRSELYLYIDHILYKKDIGDMFWKK